MIQRLIEEAQQGKPELTPKILGITSDAAPQFRRLVNALCSMPSAHYLEVGTLNGATLIAALYRNTATATAINDPYNPQSNMDILRGNLRRYLPGRAINLIEAPCLSIEPIMAMGSDQALINVCYIGADHAQDVYRTLFWFAPILASQLMLLVNDGHLSQTRTEIDMALSALRYHEARRQMLGNVYVGLVKR